MRRRRNPDYLNWAMLAGIAVGAYVLYQWLTSAGKAATTAVPRAFSSASSGLADVLETIFPHGNSTLLPTATILLANGQEIPATAPSGVGAFTDVDGTQKFQFYFNGATYRTTTGTPDETNTYYAYATSGQLVPAG
jgi:hypothetical protein